LLVHRMSKPCTTPANSADAAAPTASAEDDLKASGSNPPADP
jgi:hypothetical protein